LPVIDLAGLQPMPIAQVGDRHLLDEVLLQDGQLLGSGDALTLLTHGILQASGLC
jgi:hypothetical protein